MLSMSYSTAYSFGSGFLTSHPPKIPEAAPRPPRLPLRDAVNRVLAEHYARQRRGADWKYIARAIEAFHGGHRGLETITTKDMRDFIASCRSKGNSDSTLNVKLSVYSAMFTFFAPELGDDFRAPDIPWVKKSRASKWWCRPELADAIVSWLRERGRDTTADYILFVTHSGCRVEEALKLQREHFDFDANLMTIPGTKTDGSHRVVPMFTVARDIALKRFGDTTNRQAFLFSFTDDDTAYFREWCRGKTPDEISRERTTRHYRPLRRQWSAIRFAMKITDPTATIKALRRTFGVYATRNGMPTETLRMYYGHDDIETTQGYLKVTGGNDPEAIRKWVV